MLRKGNQVSIEYNILSDTCQELDSNIGKEPLIFLFGENQILPSLEESLQELNIGESKSITLAPEDAYGPINPHAYKTIEAHLIPEDLRIPGKVLVVSDPSFGEMMIRVDQVDNQSIVLDFNHPLAGKVLNFNVKILNITD